MDSGILAAGNGNVDCGIAKCWKKHIYSRHTSYVIASVDCIRLSKVVDLGITVGVDT